MSTFVSVHDVKKFSASTVWDPDNDCSPHITLNFEGRTFENHGSVTLYIKDAILNDRLIEVINDVVAARKAELAAAEQAETEAA